MRKFYNDDFILDFLDTIKEQHKVTSEEILLTRVFQDQYFSFTRKVSSQRVRKLRNKLWQNMGSSNIKTLKESFKILTSEIINEKI